ncbi:MAG: GtrA family protein [bacterium]
MYKDKNQITKFMLIGFLNTLFHNLIYWLFIFLQTHFLLANILAFTLSLILSFFLNSIFTYKITPTLKKLFIFPISILPNLFMQLIGIVYIVNIMGVSEKWGALFATIIAFPFTYLITTYIFKKEEGDGY